MCCPGNWPCGNPPCRFEARVITVPALFLAVEVRAELENDLAFRWRGIVAVTDARASGFPVSPAQGLVDRGLGRGALDLLDQFEGPAKRGIEAKGAAACGLWSSLSAFGEKPVVRPWVSIGRSNTECHKGYRSCEPYRLERVAMS